MWCDSDIRATTVIYRSRKDALKPQVTELLHTQKSVASIAKILDIPPPKAYQIVKELREEWRKIALDNTGEYFSAKLQEYEHAKTIALELLTVSIKEGKPKKDWWDRYVMALDKICRLKGLDAPRRSEISGPGGRPIELDVRQAVDGMTVEQLEMLRVDAERRMEEAAEARRKAQMIEVTAGPGPEDDAMGHGLLAIEGPKENGN